MIEDGWRGRYFDRSQPGQEPIVAGRWNQREERRHHSGKLTSSSSRAISLSRPTGRLKRLQQQFDNGLPLCKLVGNCCWLVSPDKEDSVGEG